MPGKVNPTQSEALLMVWQVLGNNIAISMGAATANFELNTCKPLIIHPFLQSARLLGGGMARFDEHCVRGITANHQRLAELVADSLMLGAIYLGSFMYTNLPNHHVVGYYNLPRVSPGSVEARQDVPTTGVIYG